MDSLKNSLILYSTTKGGGAFPAPPTNPTEINKWLDSAGAYFLDKPITNPFKGGMPVTVCGTSGTLKAVDDQATASTDCVIIYTATTFTDPISATFSLFKAERRVSCSAILDITDIK